MIKPVPLDGSTTLDRAMLGGKAWSVNRLRALGLPAPPAFALTTDVYRLFSHASGTLPYGTAAALSDGIAWLEASTGRTFGRGPKPLLVSVRSGAAQSMPGMMDTVLNLGLTDDVSRALSAEHGENFSADLWRRFLSQSSRSPGVPAMTGESPMAQLLLAVAAVFESWMSRRAIAYREHHGLDHHAGTAVTVQAMVFGNQDDESGTGVLFTRNPVTGDPSPYGEWLARGQGEDIVSGRVHPAGIRNMRESMPDTYDTLVSAGRILEADARDVLEIEFTIEAGALWLLQTRAAKRSAHAAIRIAAGLARDGLINSTEIGSRVRAQDVRAVLGRAIDPTAQLTATVLTQGTPASPGVASGVVVGDSETAQAMADVGTDIVLARPTTDPDDVHGMIAAVAVVTELGGSTSHAAVVSRELGRPCVVGCGADATAALLGQIVTVDGTAGLVYQGLVQTVQVTADDFDLRTLARLIGAGDMADFLAKLSPTT